MSKQTHNSKLEKALSDVEARFFIAGKSFPMPSPRDLTIYYWDKLKPIVREVIRPFIKFSK